MKLLGIVGLTIGLAVGSSGVARADKPASPEQQMIAALEAISEPTAPPDGTKLPAYYATDDGVVPHPTKFPFFEGATPWQTIVRAHTVGLANGGRSAWISADIEVKPICQITPCAKIASTWYHATAVFDADAPWHPIAWQLSSPASGKAQAAALAAGVKLPAIPDEAPPDDRNASSAFIPMLASPEVLAASISPRKDVVLYGSDTGERYVGGAAVKAQLARWGLQFDQVGGSMEGLTADKQIAWFATNVDAKAAKPSAKPQPAFPYRAFVVLAKSKQGTWELVAAQFAVVTK